MADVTISGLPKAPDNINPTLVPVSNGTSTFHLSAFSAPYSNGTGLPGVQSGTFRNVLLRSNNTGGCWIGSLESNTTSNTANYTKAAECDTYNIKIASGVRDGGYKIGLGVEGYIANSDFKGTLAYNYGIWCRHGFYSNAAVGYLPTGTIENSYGIFIDTLSGTSGAKILNSWGIYQSNGYNANSKNYLEGTTGIGTISPQSKLHVNGDLTTGTVVLSDGIQYLGKWGLREKYFLTTGKYRFTFPSIDFYGDLEITVRTTNYNRGTSEARVGKWIVPLRYSTAKTLNNITALGGNVYTNTYNSGGVGVIWNNISGTVSEMTIYNSDSNPPEVGVVELDFISFPYPNNFSIKNLFSRIQFVNTQYTTPNPYA